MENKISPKYQMKLTFEIDKILWENYKSYKNVEAYISKWQEEEYDQYSNNLFHNFEIIKQNDGNIDLKSTLNSLSKIDNGEILLKIAIDLGIETPNFIPSVPIFRNELKTNYETAYQTFEKAFKQREENPETAIGLANSALESIIKEIIKDEKLKTILNSKHTLHKLTIDILKEFQLLPNSSMPKEIKTIGSLLIKINQAIEKLRSDKTNFHGKTKEDYIINDPIYAYFIVNSISTIGLFLNSYYKTKYKSESVEVNENTDDLPF